MPGGQRRARGGGPFVSSPTALRVSMPSVDKDPAVAASLSAVPPALATPPPESPLREKQFEEYLLVVQQRPRAEAEATATNMRAKTAVSGWQRQRQRAAKAASCGGERPLRKALPLRNMTIFMGASSSARNLPSASSLSSTAAAASSSSSDRHYRQRPGSAHAGSLRASRLGQTSDVEYETASNERRRRRLRRLIQMSSGQDWPDKDEAHDDPTPSAGSNDAEPPVGPRADERHHNQQSQQMRFSRYGGAHGRGVSIHELRKQFRAVRAYAMSGPDARQILRHGIDPKKDVPHLGAYYSTVQVEGIPLPMGRPLLGLVDGGSKAGRGDGGVQAGGHGAHWHDDPSLPAPINMASAGLSPWGGTGTSPRVEGEGPGENGMFGGTAGSFAAPSSAASSPASAGADSPRTSARKARGRRHVSPPGMHANVRPADMATSPESRQRVVELEFDRHAFPHFKTLSLPSSSSSSSNGRHKRGRKQRHPNKAPPVFQNQHQRRQPGQKRVPRPLSASMKRQMGGHVGRHGAGERPPASSSPSSVVAAVAHRSRSAGTLSHIGLMSFDANGNMGGGGGSDGTTAGSAGAMMRGSTIKKSSKHHKAPRRMAGGAAIDLMTQKFEEQLARQEEVQRRQRRRARNSKRARRPRPSTAGRGRRAHMATTTTTIVSASASSAAFGGVRPQTATAGRRRRGHVSLMSQTR